MKGEEMFTANNAGTALLIFILLFAVTVLAAPPINTDSNGLAIEEYDPVAYFTLSKPVEGKKEFEYKWQNATWRFANENHLKLFKSDPEKYAPQYGGY
jgi:YHS domain-containing protein